MASSPTTPQANDIRGKIVTIACAFTSGGATQRDTFDLPTYAPKIDLRFAHPILSMLLFHPGSDTVTENYLPENEIARGSSADSSGEWDISDLDTIGIYHETNANGFVVVTYIGYGTQNA